MLQQAKWIKEFCDKEGFNFKEVDKVPCGLDRNYKEDDQTIFISNFIKGKKTTHVSYGGLKIDVNWKVPIEQVPFYSIKRHHFPLNWICRRCYKKNLNLRTDDNHKTYVCPSCHKGNSTD
jgi:hypothetical protein